VSTPIAAPTRPLPIDAAAELANDLAELTHHIPDARLAKASTDALTLANDLHDFGELLADLAGVEL
jgi:hypothetical protein